MDRCHYAAFRCHFNEVLTINCSFETKKYNKEKMKGGLSWMTKYREWARLLGTKLFRVWEYWCSKKHNLHTRCLPFLNLLLLSIVVYVFPVLLHAKTIPSPCLWVREQVSLFWPSPKLSLQVRMYTHIYVINWSHTCAVVLLYCLCFHNRVF